MAAERNYMFKLTPKYLWELYLQQGRLCNLSGIPIEFIAGRDAITATSASLDRIDSSQPYIEGNVQWTHKDINWMKNTFNQGKFIELCTLVANKHR